MKKRYENQNTGRKKRRRLSEKSIALMIVAVFLALLAVVGLVAVFAPKETNPDNLLQYKNYSNMLEESTEGLKVKWDDDGSFTLSGEHKSQDTQNNSKFLSPFASVLLEPGKYFLSSGNERADHDTYGLYFIKDGQYHEVCADVAEIDIEAATIIQVGFFVKNNKYIIYADFEPVLVPDGSSTSFYVDK